MVVLIYKPVTEKIHIERGRTLCLHLGGGSNYIGNKEGTCKVELVSASFFFVYFIMGVMWWGSAPAGGTVVGWVRGLAVASLSISVSIGSHGSNIWL